MRPMPARRPFSRRIASCSIGLRTPCSSARPSTVRTWTDWSRTCRCPRATCCRRIPRRHRPALRPSPARRRLGHLYWARRRQNPPARDRHAAGAPLGARGWDHGPANAAAGGIHPLAFHLTGLDQDALEALVRHSGTLGLEVLTGDDWALLSGSRSRLSAFARPWLVPPALSQVAVDVGLAMPADAPTVWETARGH